MPSAPTGGISIFINLTIVLVSYLFNLLKKMGLSFKSLILCGKVITSKQYDSVLRRVLAYSIVLAVGAALSVGTALSITERIQNSSDFNVVAQIIALYAHIEHVVVATVIPAVSNLFK